MTDDNDVYTPAQYREHQEGHHHREPDAHEHAGIVRDAEVSRYLSIVSNNYDPTAEYLGDGHELPGRAAELKEVRRPRRMAATETARSALADGDMPTLKHLTGDQRERADISGLKAMQRIDDVIESAAPVIVILGEMGSGKTDFAGLLGQRMAHLRDIEHVASNIRSLQETTTWTDGDGDERDGWINNFGELEEWVKQDGDPLTNAQTGKLFIGDEFSSEASGSGKSGHLTRERMGPLVFKIRKYGGMLVYIAHDESSIHPLLWRVGHIFKKVTKKRVIPAQSIKNGELRETEDPIVGVPPTDWRYRTEEASSWSWSKSSKSDDMDPDEAVRATAIWTAIRCKEEGMSNRETAAYVPYSHGWVGTRWQEYTDEGRHEDTVTAVEDVIA